VAEQIVLALAVVLSVFVLMALTLIALLVWGMRRARIGTIRCRRCQHVGLAAPSWGRRGGIAPVCECCGSDDWEAVRQVEVLDD
jgi:hypothetical protein